MPQGPGFLSRTFGSATIKPSNSSNDDAEGQPDQHAGVLRAHKIAWDEATADPRPVPATSLAATPSAEEQISGHETEVPSQTTNKTKKKGFKQLFVRWKQQLANQLHLAPPVHQTSSSSATPAAKPAPTPPQQDSHWQPRDHPQRAALVPAAVAAGIAQAATSAAPRRYSSDTHRHGSSTSQSSTPPSSHAAVTPKAAAYSPAAAALNTHRAPAAAAAVASPAASRYQALPVPDHGRHGAAHPRPSGPATPAQQQQRQQPPQRQGSSLLEQQIEQLISVETGGARPAAGAALPWSAGHPAPPPALPAAAAAAVANYAKPEAAAAIAVAAHPSRPTAAAKPVPHQHIAPAGTSPTAAAANTTAVLPITGPQDSPMARDAAALAVQFAAAHAQPPSSSNALSCSAGQTSSTGLYVMPSSSSKEPALTYTSSAGMRSGSTGSRSRMPGTHSHHVGSLAESQAEEDPDEEQEVELLSEQHAQEAAAAATAVTDADVALWMSRCAVLQEKLSGGLMAADGKLQALTARGQLVQGILVSLPHGQQRSGKHAHLVPKLHSERARVAAEASALRQRLQLLAVAINRLTAARQYLGSQTGAAMAAGDRVAILQLVLADVAERLGIWGWEELQGVAPLGDAGQQIRDMMAAAAAAAGKAPRPRRILEGDSSVNGPPPSTAAAAGVAQAARVLHTSSPSAPVASRPGGGSAPASTLGEGAAAAAVAPERAAPAKAASWHHQLPDHQTPQQQKHNIPQQQQQLYQQWPLYNPSRAGSSTGGDTRTSTAAAAAAGGTSAGLRYQTLQQHNMQKASRHPPGLPAAPVHAAHIQPAAAVAAASVAGSSRSRQQAMSVPGSGALIGPAAAAAIPRPHTSPAAAHLEASPTLSPQQQQAAAGNYSTATAHAGLAAPHTTPAAAASAGGGHHGRLGDFASDMLAPPPPPPSAAAAAASVREVHAAPLSSEAVAASYAAHSGGKVSADDELLLQYLGLSDSNSNAADRAGVSGPTFVRSRQMPQHGASGGGVMTMTGAAQQQQQQQQKELSERDIGAKGTSQRQEKDHGHDSDSEDDEAERDEAALVSDDVWGTVNSIFSTAASNMQAAGYSPSSSSFSQFTQLTAGTAPGGGSAGGTRQSFDAARRGRHAVQASRNRAAMLAESLSAAQLLVQQEDASSKDVLSTCFEALQQLVGSSSAAAHAQPPAAAAGAGSSVRQQQQQQQDDLAAAGPESASKHETATSTAAAADDDAPAADVWESADEGRDSGGTSEEQTSGAAGLSLTLAHGQHQSTQGSSQGRPRSPPATASRHVHTFDSSSLSSERQRSFLPLQQEATFDFGQQQQSWQQQQQQQHGESGSSSSSSQPWSNWAPSAAAAADTRQGGSQHPASYTAAGRGNSSMTYAQHDSAAAAPLPAGPEGAVFGRQSSLSSSAGSGSEAQFHIAGFSLTVRDLLQMLSHALQSSGTTEDIGSLPVAQLIRQTTDVQHHSHLASSGSHSQHSQQQQQHFHPAEERGR